MAEVFGRRKFLRLSIGTGAALLLAACRPAAERLTPTAPLPGPETVTVPPGTPTPVPPTPTSLPPSPTPPSTAAPLVAIRQSELWLRQSKNTGFEYKINVSYPSSYTLGLDSYPVLYGLDANGQFDFTAGIVRSLISAKELPPLIYVGIGYSTDEKELVSQYRGSDFTPTIPNNPYPIAPDLWLPSAPGGASKFLQFLVEELQPEINSRLRTLPQESGLFGHSLGGLFSLYTLFTRPETFKRYIVGSPSIWWDGAVIFDFEKAYYEGGHKDLPHKVYVGVGSNEGDMAADMENFTEAVRKRRYTGLELKTHIFEDESHISVIPFILSRGVRYVFSKSEPSA